MKFNERDNVLQTQKNKLLTTISITFIILSILLISGCSNQANINPQNQNSSSTNQQWQGGQRDNMTGGQWPNRTRNNITDAQRQEMMKARQEQLVAACQGKSQGDNCTMQTQSPRGNITLTGSCNDLQNQTICLVPNTRGQMMPGANQPPNP